MRKSRKKEKKQPGKPGKPGPDNSGFFESALQGDLKKIDAFLESGIDPNSRSTADATALMYAAHNGHEEIVVRLLDHHADPNLQDSNGYTALSIACKAGRTEIARKLIHAKADVAHRAEHGLTALILACQDNRIDTAKMLLEYGADVDAATEQGATSLLFAAAAGYEALVDLLLQRGAQSNIAESQAGHTPLLVAARKNAAIVQLLIQQGADVNATALDGKTALMVACGEGNAEAAQLLLQQHADVNAVEDELGLTPLMAAAVGGKTEIVRMLLENGASVNAQSTNGYTALIYACRYGFEDTARLLLEHNANVFLQNQDHEDALMHAKAGEHDAIIELVAAAREKQSVDNPQNAREYHGRILLDTCSLGDTYIEQVRYSLRQGADTEIRNTRGFTPLLLAAYYGYTETARALLESGADINAVEDTGGSPLYWACFGGRMPLVDLLLDKGARVTLNVWEAVQNKADSELIDRLMAVAARQAGLAHPPEFGCECTRLTHVTSPSDAQSKGLYTIVKEDIHEGWSEIYCVCNTCKRRWKVTEDTSYHYTTYSWEEIKDAAVQQGGSAAAKSKPQRLQPYAQYQVNRSKLRTLIRDIPKAAREAAEIVLFFDPDDLLARMILGMACRSTGDSARAQQNLADAAAKSFSKEQVTEVQEFLDFLLKEHRHELLRYGTEFVKPFTQENADTLFAEAVARGAGGDAAGARDILERVVKLKPDHSDAWYNLGIAHMETGAPKEAVRCHERALAITPDNHPVLYHLGVAREAAGDPKGALRAYEDAYRTRPTWGGQRDYSKEIQNALSRLKDPKAPLKARHTRDVECLDFTSDGKILASGSLDCTILLWEASRGKPLMLLEGHTNRVDCVTFSPDRKHIASWECLGNTYFLWNAETGKRIKSWSGESISVWKIAFSPDSAFLAVEAGKTCVALVDLATLTEAKRMSGHTDEITTIAYHPAGKLLASGSRDQSVRVWDTATSQQVQKFEMHKKVLGSVAFSPDGKFFASGGYDGLFCLWEVDTWKEVRIVQLGESVAVKNIVFSPANRLVFLIAAHTVQTLDPESGEMNILIPNISVVSSFALSPDARFLATGHSDYHDYRVAVWEVETRKQVWRK